jgi:hypothetical protein
MKKAAITLRTLSLAVIIAARALVHETRATVIWSFYETGISCFLGLCELPTQPYVLMTLTLPGATSSGTARWGGSLLRPRFLPATISPWIGGSVS